MSNALPGMMRGAMLLGPEQIEVRDVPVPRPAAGEILVGVRAATTCGTDVKVYLRGGHPRMLRTPTLFGHEVAGVVAACGAGVSNVREGDRVVISNSAPCGACRACLAGRENLCPALAYLNGAYAEFLSVPARFVERSLYQIPGSLSFDRAALSEPLACVLHGVEACELEQRGRFGPVDTVVLGAGPIGLLFTAVMSRAGHRVVVSDPNSGRLAIALELGAARTLESPRGTSAAEILRAASADGDGFEVAVDCTGRPQAWNDALCALRPGGLVNFFGGCAPGSALELDTHLVHYSELTLKGVYHHRPATVAAALRLLAEPDFPADALLSGTGSIDDVEGALRSMIDKRTLKVVIKPEHRPAPEF